MATDLQSGASVDHLRWGSHLCHFYDSADDLLDIVASYFKAGLENNEFCLWTVPKSVSPADATAALRHAIPKLDRHLASQHLEIVHSREWYLEGERFDPDRVMRGWFQKLDAALARGLAGMRVAGNADWIGERHWPDFARYERALNDALRDRQLIVLCSYQVGSLGAAALLDVVRAHERALARRPGSWEIVGAPDFKRAEEEARYRTLFESAHDVIVMMNDAGNILDVNRHGEVVSGYSQRDLRQMNVYRDLLLPEDRPALRRMLDDLLKGETRECRVRWKTKTGDPVYLEGAPVSYFSLTGEFLTLWTLRDVTERVQAEQRITAINDRLREYEKAMEGLDEMICVVDRDYRYLIANRAFLTYRGLEREQVVGHAAPELLHPDVWETTTKQKLDECFSGKVVAYELRYTYPHLGERDLAISYFPIEGPAGVDRVACILQDITARKKAEAALHGLSAQLLRLEDTERRRLARELHDGAAQQLAALSWNLSVVNEAAVALNPPVRRALAESVALADACLREIRTVSYLLHPPELDELGLQAALARYVDGFAQRSGIRIETEVPSDLGRLPHDVETTVFRIVQEGLTNVHRHSGSSTARICLRRGPSELVLDMQDAGTGMRDHAAPGVSIASMQERVQQVGGSLEIDSQPSGTRIKAVIPLSGGAA